LEVTPPIRILGLVASPTGLPLLDTGREKARMEEALAGLRRQGLLDITWLRDQTWTGLMEALGSGGGGPWHAFHFIGHGGFDTEANEGCLALETEHGDRYSLTATDLGRLLGDCPSVRLAVLNCCEGARAGGTDVFSSMAATLMRRGLAAVVSMQYEISDQAAIKFSQEFYRTLATGYPVDAAVAEARKAVSFAMQRSVEWATPVLHMRSPDGRLFDLKGATQTPVPPEIKAAPTMVDSGQVDEGKKPTIPVGVENEARQTEKPRGLRTYARWITAAIAAIGAAIVLLQLFSQQPDYPTDTIAPADSAATMMHDTTITHDTARK
jgi:hypothetical protein